MTIERAWELVKEHESKGVLDAIGDDGRAAGAGQMWWIFRKDYWPAWGWNVLEALDAMAFRRCLAAHPGRTLRKFYETVYNPHASALDLPDEPID